MQPKPFRHALYGIRQPQCMHGAGTLAFGRTQTASNIHASRNGSSRGELIHEPRAGKALTTCLSHRFSLRVWGRDKAITVLLSQGAWLCGSTPTVPRHMYTRGVQTSGAVVLCAFSCFFFPANAQDRDPARSCLPAAAWLPSHDANKTDHKSGPPRDVDLRSRCGRMWFYLRYSAVNREHRLSAISSGRMPAHN